MTTFRTNAARVLVAAALTLGIAGTGTAAFALQPVGPGGTVVGPIGPGDHPEIGDIDDLTIDPCPDDPCGGIDPTPEPEPDDDLPEAQPEPDHEDEDDDAGVDDAVVAHPTFTG
ncbi:MAG TPA: hypothetical protein VIY72_02060 [Acidimicrobiales bacterium]